VVINFSSVCSTLLNVHHALDLLFCDNDNLNLLIQGYEMLANFRQYLNTLTLTYEYDTWIERVFFWQVLHPKNPFAPTLHFNYRYFETDAPKGIFLCNKI
jgi:hypothetical protein